MRSLLHKVALWLAGLIFGAFLVVQDEILTLAIYCGANCQYPYPFIGAFSLYNAEIIADAVMLTALVFAWWAARGWTAAHDEDKP